MAGLFVLSKQIHKKDKIKASTSTFNNNMARAMTLIIIIICITTYIYVYRYFNSEKKGDRIEHIHLIQIAICVITALVELFISSIKVGKDSKKIISIITDTFKYHVFAPMGRFQLESIYLYFPPSSQLGRRWKIKVN